MKKYDDGYPDLGFSYSNKGHGVSNGWKWTAIISLSMSVLLAVSFVLYAVLRGSTPVDTTPQGEYWRTHENTRLGDDVIDEWLSEWLGGDSEHPSDGLHFDETDLANMLTSILDKMSNLDEDMWMYLHDDNTSDLVSYMFEPLTSRSEEIQNIVDDSYSIDDLPSPKDPFRDLLIRNGMSSVAISTIIGTVATIKVTTLGALIFPPVTVPLAIAAIGTALLVLTVIIYDNWSIISRMLSDFVKFLAGAAGFLGWVVTGFLDREFANARRKMDITYDKRVYTQTVLDADFVRNRASKNRNEIYLVLGRTKGNNSQIILGILGTGLGSITESYALTVMRMGPGDKYLFSGVGSMVVSIYTYLDSKAKEIAQNAGGVPPIRHDTATPQGQGKVEKGRFRHYHNGATFALFPNKNDGLPHAFFGSPVV